MEEIVYAAVNYKESSCYCNIVRAIFLFVMYKKTVLYYILFTHEAFLFYALAANQ